MEFGLYEDLEYQATKYWIQVIPRSLPPKIPVQFDGLTITLDPAYDAESRCYYLAHAIASIALWTTDLSGTQRIFDELQEAETVREEDQDRFLQATASRLSFEGRASNHAVWLLEDVEHEWAIPGYTIFFRAKMAAMEEYYRTGTAPAWREHYPGFKKRMTHVIPFKPTPIPQFMAIMIPTQRMIRE